MEKKFVLIGIATIACIWLVIGSVIALPLLSQLFPSSGLTPTQPTLSFQVTVDGVTYTSGSVMSWGDLAYGDNDRTLVIQNTGTVPITISVTYTDLPTGFDLTASDLDLPIQPGESDSGLLTLFVPSDAPSAMTIHWNTIVTGTEVTP